jgi:hypothetical protein
MKGDSQEFQMAAQPEGKTLLLLLPFFSIYSVLFYFFLPPLSLSRCAAVVFVVCRMAGKNRPFDTTFGLFKESTHSEEEDNNPRFFLLF